MKYRQKSYSMGSGMMRCYFKDLIIQIWQVCLKSTTTRFKFKFKLTLLRKMAQLFVFVFHLALYTTRDRKLESMHKQQQNKIEMTNPCLAIG